MLHTHLPVIDAKNPPDWTTVATVPIQPVNEHLVKINQQPRLQPCSVYFLDRISGALPDIWLRDSVAKRLTIALSLLPKNIGLRLLDGYRPFEVQLALRQIVADDLLLRLPEISDNERLSVLNQFVAVPSRNQDAPSPHLTGGSVDVTLFDVETNTALNMGTSFDSPEPASWTAFYETQALQDSEVNQHRRLLCHAMTAAGFTNLPTEWWHFDYGNQLWAHYSGQTHAVYAVAEYQE